MMEASQLMKLSWKIALAVGLLYSVVHVVVSGILYPLSSPNVGQIVEELQPLLRLFTQGVASVDHPRQYGPVFLMAFHLVYQRDLVDPTVLAWYAYALEVVAIVIGFVATMIAIRHWAAARGHHVSWLTWVCVFMLWANFSPLYGVLAIKNVEIWELACIAVAGAALLRGRPWIVAVAIAAGALIKMLPLVFLPYLWLRQRSTFFRTLAAMAVILAMSQALYGTQMGFGYFGNLVKAAGGGEGFGNPRGMIWHENVSLRGLTMKAFGFLEKPGSRKRPMGYTEGYHVVVPDDLAPIARTIATTVQVVAGVWVVWTLWTRRRRLDPSRTYWDWAFVAIMMLVLAPQISQDYMILTLGAFSFVLAACLFEGDRFAWINFGIAVLLVGNVLPRGVFSRLLFVDQSMAWSGHEHLMRAEAYQYYGYPLLGLLFLTRAWLHLAARPEAMYHE
jgi:hypothetical protein